MRGENGGEENGGEGMGGREWVNMRGGNMT